jgi:adenine C2-methylase RlmN of 23S rRNA A2503 and tRNA A37
MTSATNRQKKIYPSVENAGIVCMVRKSRGGDIDAACGQLANKTAD